jgi:hypothetical protein
VSAVNGCGQGCDMEPTCLPAADAERSLPGTSASTD